MTNGAQTTSTTLGADFERKQWLDWLAAWLDAGEYPGDAIGRLVDPMLAHLRNAVEARLPDGVSWQPADGAFVHPVSTQLPDHDAMRTIFEEAAQDVMVAFPSIEAAVLGAPSAATTDPGGHR